MKRQLFLVHRWTGVVLCLFMAMWFISGVVMMYVGYPKLTHNEHLAALPPLDGRACCHLAPQAQGARSVRLTTIGGNPRLVIVDKAGVPAAHDAVSGQVLPPIGQTEANSQTGALWRTVTVSGAPIAAPGAVQNGLTLFKRLLSFDGGAVDPSRLRQGDRVIVLVSGRSPQARSTALVIDDPLPAGFEIETVLGPDDAQSGPFRFLGELSSPDVAEARDDRYVAALDLPGKSAFAFAYVARAVTPGDFLLPGAQARDMYRPGLNARTASGRTVVAPGG